MQDEVCQRDGLDEVLFLPAPEGSLLEGLKLVSCGVVAELTRDVLEDLGKKTASPAARIVNGLVHLGVDDLDHRLDDLARREELAAGRALMVSNSSSAATRAFSTAACLSTKFALAVSLTLTELGSDPGTYTTPVAFGGTVTFRVSVDPPLVHDEAILPRTLSSEASA
jgi:hypothetical protein